MAPIPQTHRFNVGGKHYEVSQSLLDQHPDTMLARLASKTWNDGKAQEIFIERDGDRFRFVLDFLRDGMVVLPLTSDPKETFIAELQYFGIEYDEGNIQEIADCRGFTSIAVDHINTVREAVRQSLHAAHQKQKEALDDIEMLHFVQDCVEEIVGDNKSPSSNNIFRQRKKKFVSNLTVEKACDGLAPFGLQCGTLEKNNDNSGFKKVKVEALNGM